MCLPTLQLSDQFHTRPYNTYCTYISPVFADLVESKFWIDPIELFSNLCAYFFLFIKQVMEPKTKIVLFLMYDVAVCDKLFPS